MIPSPAAARRSAEEERADTLAYLDRKMANAAAIVAKSPEHADAAIVARRAWEVARDDIRGGLHEGETGVVAQLTQGGL